MRAGLVAILVVACIQLALVSARPALAQSRAPGQVLLIGNSLSRGIRRPLRQLLRAAGYYSIIKSVAPSGWLLADHASSARTRRAIASRPWDYVVLQEQSSSMDQRRYPSSRALAALAAADGAKSMFMMTWRDRGAPLETYDWLRGTPGGLFGYVPIAFELGAAVAPVGWAIRESALDGLPFDLWKDGHHLNNSGRYLAACVLFATLLMQSPVGLPAPHAMRPMEAYYFQALAATTVMTSPWQWNIRPW